MASNDVPIYAISLQNEPDINVSYDSCDWSPQQMISWLNAEASKFGDTKLVAAESYNYNKGATDPILNDASASALFDIVGVHLYGARPSDYPLALNKGKEIWMTEHYTDSNTDANRWPSALDVGKEIHDCMASNFSAYIWWYIRRSYGPITEDGKVSKRGYMIAQYSKFVRPGFVRVDTSGKAGLNVTAYRQGRQVVVVFVNTNSASQTLSLGINAGSFTSLEKYTTSSSKNVQSDPAIALTGNVGSVTLDGQSVTTLVGESAN